LCDSLTEQRFDVKDLKGVAEAITASAKGTDLLPSD
jgi:hypothetical protein